MKLIADRMLRGADVIADAGEPFTCSDKLGRAFIAAGVAHLAPAEKAELEPEPAPEIETAAEQPAAPVEKAVEPAAKPRRKRAAKKVSGKK